MKKTFESVGYCALLAALSRSKSVNTERRITITWRTQSISAERSRTARKPSSSVPAAVLRPDHGCKSLGRAPRRTTTTAATGGGGDGSGGGGGGEQTGADDPGGAGKKLFDLPHLEYLNASENSTLQSLHGLRYYSHLSLTHLELRQCIGA